MYVRVFRKAAHVHAFVINMLPSQGWEVREEHDSEIVRRVQYDDWHRVERAKLHFAVQALSLAETGWVES